MAELVHAPVIPVARRRNVLAVAVAMAIRALALLVLLAGAVAFVFPLLWMFSTSLKDLSQVFLVPPMWIPPVLHWENYPKSLTFFPFFLYLRNTLIIVVPSV